MKLTPKTLANNQSGLVSFMMTLFIMIVLTLIVLGFAAIARREQRQALDDQLSTQAFYAAETGVNDARKALAANTSLSITDCNIPAGFTSQIDAAAGVAYTCLLIDPSPTSLVFSDIPDGTAKAFPVTSANGVNISQITLSWQNTVSTSNDITCPAPNNLPPSGSSNWTCDMPLMRIDIVPLNSPTRANLIANTMTAFLYPRSGIAATTLTYNTANTGAIQNTRCQAAPTPRLCTINIDVSSLAQANYYIRLRPIYADADVFLSATDGTNTLELIGAQAVIDSTGKAQDVLRRIQVHIPTALPTIVPPDFAIQSVDSICKRFTVGNSTDVALDGIASGDAACDLFN